MHEVESNGKQMTANKSVSQSDRQPASGFRYRDYKTKRTLRIKFSERRIDSNEPAIKKFPTTRRRTPPRRRVHVLKVFALPNSRCPRLRHRGPARRLYCSRNLASWCLSRPSRLSRLKLRRDSLRHVTGEAEERLPVDMTKIEDEGPNFVE